MEVATTRIGDIVCGRFKLEATGDEVAAGFGLPEAPEIEARFNVAPTQAVLTVRPCAAGGREAAFVRWGLIPQWAKDASIGSRLINARSETVATTPAFRDGLRRRRCLVPADGFYEWRREGRAREPFLIRLRGGGLFAFAGLWSAWNSPGGGTIESCTILTTRPNDLVARLHDRMPVILPPGAYGEWLAAEAPPPDAMERLLAPFPADLMETFPVGPLVNRPGNDGPECAAPVAAARGELL
jgi:putative SOS response-associated peptidase YedK